MITYTDVNSLASAGDIAKGYLDFLCLDLPLASASAVNFLQVPVAGAAVVPAYHLSFLNDNETLVLDGETLAMIFMGNITTWDHPAIQSLNPNITLPHANITIAVTPGQALAQTDVFKQALSLFSGEFAKALANAGSDFSKMRPALEGRAAIAADESARIKYVKVKSHVITVCSNNTTLINPIWSLNLHNSKQITA